MDIQVKTIYVCVCARAYVYLKVLRDRVNKIGKLSHGKERACVYICIYIYMYIFVYMYMHIYVLGN